ncbi:MAG: SWIM zinc finger family protein [Rhodospirillales bacterium]|nr:MAG: SWIM zinc finger family protein [Rhodospirillales bacterium]
MRSKGKPRFDVAALRRFAGDKVFARGEAYVERGQVEILAIEPGRVLAVVAGGEDYRTEVTGRGAGIGGECSCPAFERGFCKHMVAVALAANAAGGDAGATVDALPRIRAHLKAKGVDALVDMVVGFAERDRALFRKLDLAAAALAGDDKTVEARLRKAIDDATRVRSYVEYHAVPAWAAGVDAALDAVAELAAAGRAGVALALAQRAIDRIAAAIESVDDSDGYCGASLARARDIHLAAAGVARPDPVALARPYTGSRRRVPATSSTAPRGSTPRSWARKGWPSTAAWPPRRGRSCRRAPAGAARGGIRRTTPSRYRTPRSTSSTPSPSATAMSTCASPCAPRICRRRRTIRRWPSSACRRDAPTRRCGAPRKGCGCSRTARRTTGSCCSPPTCWRRPGGSPTPSRSCGGRSRSRRTPSCTSACARQAARRRARGRSRFSARGSWRTAPVARAVSSTSSSRS